MNHYNLSVVFVVVIVEIMGLKQHWIALNDKDRNIEIDPHRQERDKYEATKKKELIFNFFFY